MTGQSTRRDAILGAGAAVLATALPGRSAATFRLGLTPVFLDNDATVIELLRRALSTAMATRIDLIQRRTYAEVTGLLLEGSVDAAWLCGYPYLQHEAVLALAGVPVWRGQPLYQSYLVVGTEDPAASLMDLRGGTHAFSDPDSNSGYLVTASDLARAGETPEGFFGRAIFTYGHRNVVRAVASGLTRSGSVDGYVWEALSVVEPGITQATRVIAQSEWLAFPPFCSRRDRVDDPAVSAFRTALSGMTTTAEGRAALAILQLDAIAEGDPRLFDGIALRMREVARLR